MKYGVLHRKGSPEICKEMLGLPPNASNMAVQWRRNGGGGGGGLQGLAPPLNSARLYVHASGVGTTKATEAGAPPLLEG